MSLYTFLLNYARACMHTEVGGGGSEVRGGIMDADDGVLADGADEIRGGGELDGVRPPDGMPAAAQRPLAVPYLDAAGEREAHACEVPGDDAGVCRLPQARGAAHPAPGKAR